MDQQSPPSSWTNADTSHTLVIPHYDVTCPTYGSLLSSVVGRDTPLHPVTAGYGCRDIPWRDRGYRVLELDSSKYLQSKTRDKNEFPSHKSYTLVNEILVNLLCENMDDEGMRGHISIPGSISIPSFDDSGNDEDDQDMTTNASGEREQPENLFYNRGRCVREHMFHA